ncbi:MAG: hypothetical protein ACO29Z_08635 [Crocinitomicaceae bacterium]
MKIIVRLILLFSWMHCTFAQEVWMYPNKGQWDARILYNLPLAGVRFYL